MTVKVEKDEKYWREGLDIHSVESFYVLDYLLEESRSIETVASKDNRVQLRREQLGMDTIKQVFKGEVSFIFHFFERLVSYTAFNRVFMMKKLEKKGMQWWSSRSKFLKNCLIRSMHCTMSSGSISSNNKPNSS